jgi:type IV pilus assembly protein PilC
LADASSTATNSVLRRRVEHWRALLESGQDIHHAARAAAMPALMVGMLATANQAAHSADILRFLARYYETRFSRIRALIHGAVIPIMVLIAGALVLLVMAGLFMPMVDMINSLAIDYVP